MRAFAKIRCPSKRRGAWRFLVEGRAFAAVEFGLLLPVMLLLLLGTAELSRMIIFSRRIDLVASTAVQMLTQNSSGYVNYVDLHFAQDSTMVIFPQLLNDASKRSVSWSSDISMSMASVTFVKTSTSCTSSCTYNAFTVWSGGASPRPCGVSLSATSDTATPSSASLPTDLYGPGSIIVVDIVYNYRPIFNVQPFRNISIARSAYLAPRYVSLIKYQAVSGDDGIGQECPGY